MIPGLADLEAVIQRAKAAWKPPPKLTLSEWADQYFYLSAESSAEPGRWTTLPYQRGIMDAFTDPMVEQVSVMKSARVGWTKIVNALIGYSIHQDPCPIMVVQPTVEDAKGYSKEEIAPMIRDCPELAKIVYEDQEEEAGPRESGNTILHKKFTGGVLSLVGANSGTGFRRVSRKRVLFDEVDGYPPSAGSDGDQIKLGIKRAEYYWDRKIGAGSTPLVAGSSRIESLFNAGDQRRFYVPCPQCGHMDYLTFREEAERGHYMKWPKGKPEEAFFVCRARGCVIEHKDKRDIVTRGEWRAGRDPVRFASGREHRSFHIWAAYSFSPNATWGQIAEEFLDAKSKGPEALKTFINTVLGETWQERGEAPDWERLYRRREHYPIGTVPNAVQFLTAGVDVQKDRLVWEVVGWGPGKESWSIDAGVIPGSAPLTWADYLKLDDLLNRTWTRVDGVTMAILMLAIDSGFDTQNVYSWARRHSMSRVIATKGQSNAKTIIGSPTAVDVTIGGRKVGYKMWPVGVDVVKAELYSWLRLEIPIEPGAVAPPGYCHFPEYGEDYFKQLTAEQLVSHKNQRGFTIYEWQILPGRENHFLDCRVYARAAAALAGLDRMAPRAEAPPPPPIKPVMMVGAPAAAPSRPPRPSGFLNGRGTSWIQKKR